MTSKSIIALSIVSSLFLAGCVETTEPELEDNDLSILPETGTYTFIMDGTGTLSGDQCPETVATPVASGPAQLDSAANELSLTMTAGSTTVSFSRATTADILQSDVLQFPVEDNEETYIGEVSYQLDYWTADYAQGVLHWDNGLGCSGDYPFTLE